jgi:hypothetical protein
LWPAGASGMMAPMSIAPWFALVSTLAAAGTVVDLGGLHSAAPAAWKEVPVTNPMRVKQFTVPGPGKEGEAELVVFFFGQGQGGATQANLDRWKAQFQPPEGKTLEPKTSTLKTASGAPATVLDISGTYLFKASPMAPGPAEPRPNHRMIAAVLETPGGNYYLKLVGPAKTIEKSKKEFDAWLKAFK